MKLHVDRFCYEGQLDSSGTNTPYKLGTACAFFDCSKGTECALCAQSVKGISCGPNSQAPSSHLLHNAIITQTLEC